ncbi:MAG TPA: phage portal protein [Tepidisphaeraceae bacterium]|jgi:hypothetical protein|nr:phage portal protein [Tepidisphaeraceae bacterium]
MIPDPKVLQQRLRDGTQRLLAIDGPRYRRLWAYYRNPMRVVAVDADDNGSHRPYRQAQEWGLPSRITGVRSATDPDQSQQVDGVARKEVVVENDIGWRVDTMVDSLFGKPLGISSLAPDPNRRQMISELLRLIVAQNGGVSFLQQIALLGGVYGFVDVLVKLDRTQKIPADALAALSMCGTGDLGHGTTCDDRATNESPAADAPSSASADSSTITPVDEPAPATTLPVTGLATVVDDAASDAARHATQAVSPDVLMHIARVIRLEIVEPARALPVLADTDVRVVQAYAQAYHAPRITTDKPQRAYKARWIDRVKRSAVGLMGARDPQDAPPAVGDEQDALIIDLITPTHWQRYEDERLVASGINALGIVPLVHVQNVAEPFAYEGASDVEPLVPLQDELNTRLSDRANRITLQSFKMYLGKGIEGFGDLAVTPGRMWSTDNMDANVIEFGGDAACPSEDAHIAEVREALDKTSGVTPIAAGAIKGRIGRLTSAAALRITLQALLNRTEKKRTTYGTAIERMCELSLAWLDVAGIFKTTPQERRVELTWPSPIPQNESELLEQAQAKLRVGVPPTTVLRELGY